MGRTIKIEKNQFAISALIQFFVAILAGDILVKYFLFHREVKMDVFYAFVALVIALSRSYRSYKTTKK